MTGEVFVPKDLSPEGRTARVASREIGKRPLKSQLPTIIPVPREHPEKYKVSGFVFSRRFLKASKLPSLKMPETEQDWQHLQKYAALVKQIEMDSDGGPMVNDNWIKIWISSGHSNAGSDADHIWMHFGRHDKLKLPGVEGTRFPAGHWLQWDLNPCSDFLENIPTDAWDEIHLENPSGDGMLVQQIKIVHSGVTILDWRCNEWLDGSAGEKYGRMGLAGPILQHKLEQVEHAWVPQIHWAARELGKSDWRKYGRDTAWCSEFASWCLAKALWDVPEAADRADGKWGSEDMQNWFDARGRKFDRSDVTGKRYILTAGDYLRVLNGEHSALFVRYLDGDPVLGPDTPADSTRIRTIEGNTSKTANVRQRTVSQITSIGSTR